MSCRNPTTLRHPGAARQASRPAIRGLRRADQESPLRIATDRAGNGRRGGVRRPRRNQAHGGIGSPTAATPFVRSFTRSCRATCSGVCSHGPTYRPPYLPASHGVALALPFLPSMRPAFAGTTGERPRRMVNICATLGLYSIRGFPRRRVLATSPPNTCRSSTSTATTTRGFPGSATRNKPVARRTTPRSPG